MFSISPEQKGASASSMYVLGLVCTVCLPSVMLLQSATLGLAWRVPVGAKNIGEVRGLGLGCSSSKLLQSYLFSMPSDQTHDEALNISNKFKTLACILMVFCFQTINLAL